MRKLMMTTQDELDYVLQLQSVFDSCDTSASGTLNRKELFQLCEKLQFESQAQTLTDILLEDDPDSRVDFVHFKDAFVAVLSETMGSSDEEEDTKDGDLPGPDHGTPYHPSVTRQELLLRLSSLEEVDEDQRPSSGERSPTARSQRIGPKMSPKTLPRVSPEVSPRISPRMTPSLSPTTTPIMTPGVSPPSSPSTPPRWCRKPSETFEAEGQMEPPKADGELAVEEHRRHIHLVWQELEVGKNGFLTMEELATVCEKIGMEQMNDEELQHLFDKLDVDCDGRVSFDEFLHGLFQYGSSGATPSPSRQLSTTPRQKLRRALSSHIEENRQTPSLITSGSGLFSPLDIDNTGFAKPDDIIALWESFGIPQGGEILEYLQFSLTTKVNLMDLSYALEQEMRTVEEDNATYQAAIASYEYELRFLKHQTEHLMAERNKLKADLTEVNNRIIILVKEGDERYTLLEKSKEKEKDELEKKYQEQIRVLQSELDRERETFYHQSSTETQKLESSLNVLKEEESKLKDRVASVEKDCDRLEKENHDMAEKYADLEAKKARLQRDLEATAELQHKLEEMESSRDVFLDEHQKFSEQKLHQLESENKELKDKADELTVEIEELRQQVLAHKRRFRDPMDQHGESRLTDYDKLFRADNYSPQGTGDEASEDDIDTVKIRRRLPRRPSDTHSEEERGTNLVSLLTEKLQDEVNQLTMEKESLLAQHQEEVASQQNQYEDRISQLLESNEEQMKVHEQQLDVKLDALSKEHDSIVQSIRRDHQEIIKSLESHYQHKLNEQEQICDDKCEQLRSENDNRLKALQKEHDVELTLLQSKHEERLERLRDEYEDKIKEIEREESSQLEGLEKYQERIKVMERKHKEELEKMQEEYEHKIAEMDSVHIQELDCTLEECEEEKKELERRHEETLDTLQTEHDEEVKGLQQKLEGLFSESSIKTEEVNALHRGFSLERKDIEDAYKMEIAEMEDRHMQKMNELLKKSKAEKENLRTECESELNEKVQQEVTRIKEELAQEKRDILIKAESEKNLLHVDFEKEKERIVAKHQLELAKKEVDVEKLRDKVKMQPEELQKQSAAYELQMKLQKEELELEFKKEKINLFESFEQEKIKLLEKHRNDIYDYENVFMKGTGGLRGQLQTDFFRLLEEHKRKEEEKIEAELREEIRRERQLLTEELRQERAMEVQELRREKELLEQEKVGLLQREDTKRSDEKVEAERERERIIAELTEEKERVEREWKADKDRLSKLGVVGSFSSMKDSGEGQVVFETREVRREVSRSVYDTSRESERIQRSGTDGCVLCQDVAVVSEKEMISKQSDSIMETELTEIFGDNVVKDSERRNTVNNIRIESSKLETDDGKNTLVEHVDKSDSSTVELEKTIKKNGKTVTREYVKKDRNNNQTVSDNDYVKKDAVLAALTPINPIALEDTNFTDKQKEFICRWRSKSNVKDKIKMFSNGEEPSGGLSTKSSITSLNDGSNMSHFDDKEQIISDVQCQNIYPDVVIREKTLTQRDGNLCEDDNGYLRKADTLISPENVPSVARSCVITTANDLDSGSLFGSERRATEHRAHDVIDGHDQKMSNFKSAANITDTKNTANARNTPDTKNITDNNTLTADTRNTANTTDTRNTASTADTKNTANTRDIRNTAQTADTRNTAQTADTRNTAHTADTRNTAQTADTRNTAQTADIRNTAQIADTRNTAHTADTRNTAHTADTRNTANRTDTKNTTKNATSAVERITTEKDQVKIIKEVCKEKETVTRTKVIDSHLSSDRNDAIGSNNRKQQKSVSSPQVKSVHSPQTLTTPKNTPPRKKPRLDKPMNLPPDTDWVYIRERKKNSSFLVSVFSIFLRVHMAKNGW